MLNKALFSTRNILSTFRNFSNTQVISPLDGRYSSKVTDLANIFSEKGLMRYRVNVEIEWLKNLINEKICPLPHGHSQAEINSLLNKIKEVNTYYEEIKEIEAVTNHDVKAVEYFIKNHMKDQSSLAPLLEYVHFTCTSEDINNVSYALCLHEAKNLIMDKSMNGIVDLLAEKSVEYKDSAMMARTHGQPATPTTMGKEMANFAYRLHNLQRLNKDLKFAAKLNGATGNYNAHILVHGEFNWPTVSKNFIDGLGLEWNPYSTQIESHDSMCEYFRNISAYNTILLGLTKDIWHYISLGYFKQRIVSTETGSSTMPHKVNPIMFENSEGNLGIANSLYDHFATKLPISRYQRDLSDSTVLRNIGVAFGHSKLAYDSFNAGFKRLDINEQCLREELDDHWELLAEPIQMMMRKYDTPNPYEKLKEFSRAGKVTEESVRQFVSNLDMGAEDKEKLMKLRPETYIGLASQFAGDIHKHLK